MPLPVEIAARLKLGFKLMDAMPFTASMAHYPQFHTVRRVQHIRETKLVEMMQYIKPQDKEHFVKIITSMSKIYSNSNR